MKRIIYIVLFFSLTNIVSSLAQVAKDRSLIIGEVSGRTDYTDIKSILDISYQPVDFSIRYPNFRLVKETKDEVIYRHVHHSPESPNQIIFRFYESELELLAALVIKEIDFARTESAKIAEEVQKADPSIRILFQQKPLNYAKMVAYNNQNPLFSNRNIRQALTLAINKQYIVTHILDSRADIASAPVDKKSRLYESVFKELRFKPQEAIKLLKQEGWYDINRDGILEKNKRPFRFVLYYAKGLLPDEDVARIIKLAWLRIGIDVSIQPLDKRDLTKLIKNRQYDAILLDQYFGENFTYFEDIFSISGANNYMNYTNKTVNYFFQIAKKADPQTKEQLFRGIINSVINDQPASFLFFPWMDWYFIDSKKFSNFQNANGDLKSFDEWQINR